MSNDGPAEPVFTDGPMSRDAARNAMSAAQMVFQARFPVRVAEAAKRTAGLRRSIGVDILGKLIELSGVGSSCFEVINRRKPGFYPPPGFKHRNQRQRRRDARRSGRPLQRNKGR